MTASLDLVARQVLNRFDVSPTHLQFLGNYGGFSGARLWRVATPAGDWCLKAWPPATIAGTLRFAHEVMAIARHAGLTFVPLPRAVAGSNTWVHAADRIWDLTTWQPGRADFHARPTRERLAAACVALALLHDCWVDVPRRFGGAIEISESAIARRLRAARDWETLVATGWQPRFAAIDAGPVRPWAERACRVIVRRADYVRGQLAQFDGRDLTATVCLCDIWHDHVLFTGEAVTGIVDFGSLKLDTVAVDLSRLLGSLVGDDADAMSAGMGAYSAVRPLSIRERGLVEVLDRTGVVVGIMNWLRWLYHEQRQYEDRGAVAARLAALVRRAETWA